MTDLLKKEFEYYLANQDELIKLHKDKFVVIKNSEVIGVYDSEFDAITETAKQNELGTFLVQKCEQGNSSFTHMYHSRVVIV